MSCTNNYGLKFLKEKENEPDVVKLPSGTMYKVLRVGHGTLHPTEDSPADIHYIGYTAQTFQTRGARPEYRRQAAIICPPHTPPKPQSGTSLWLCCAGLPFLSSERDRKKDAWTHSLPPRGRHFTRIGTQMLKKEYHTIKCWHEVETTPETIPTPHP